MKIIAFAGPARAGKSECAGIVAETLKDQYKVVRESFAKPMRDAWERLASYLTWKSGKLINRDTEPALYRSTMQRWGESRRKRDLDHWSVRMASRLIGHKYEEKQRYEFNENVRDWRETLVLIDDMRYLNEVCLVRQLNGICIFVDPKTRIDLTEEFRQHESEELAMGYIAGKYEDELFDHVITNSGSTARLLSSVVRHIDRWLLEAVT